MELHQRRSGSLTFDAVGNIYGTSQGMTNQILDAVAL